MAEHFSAESVWPVYIFPEEVGSKCDIKGLGIFALHSTIPNLSEGQLDIFNPSGHVTPLITWGRDKIRRAGRLGLLIWIEIGSGGEGGPGLVWMYTGDKGDAAALSRTLHNFRYHGDGRLATTDLYEYDVINYPTTGYHNHPPTRVHDSSPVLEGSPVYLDKPPSPLICTFDYEEVQASFTRAKGGILFLVVAYMILLDSYRFQNFCNTGCPRFHNYLTFL